MYYILYLVIYLLYHQYQPELSRFASWLTGESWIADDILQDALVSAIKHLDALPSGISFRAWMFMNIRFAWSRHYRCERREYRNFCLYHRMTDPLKEDNTPDTDQILRPWKQHVAKALGTLHPMYRRPLILHEILGMNCASVSEAEQVYEGTIKSRLARGRRLLRQRLLMVAREENFISWKQRQ